MTEYLSWGSTGCFLIALLGVAGCGDVTCPDGTAYEGKRCVELMEDAGGVPSSDAAVLDGGHDSGSPHDAGHDGGSAAVDSGGDGLCSSAEDGCDLVVSCSVADPIEGIGDVVSVETTVANIGTGTAGPFEVEISVERADTMVFETVATRSDVVPLAGGESRTKVSTFVAPGWLQNGANAVRCQVDVADAVTEAMEDNNAGLTDLIATGKPDLLLDAVSIPSPLDGTPGATFTVQFDVANEGQSNASSTPWTIVAADVGGGGTIRSGDEGPLSASSAVHVELTLTVPYHGYRSGDGTVRVLLDNTDAVDELREDNNGFVRTVVWE